MQTDGMASAKKEKWTACFLHTTIYTSLFILSGFAWWQLALVFVQHYAQDKTNFVKWFMVVKKTSGFAKEPFAPWSLILVDNILHILFLAFVAWLGDNGLHQLLALTQSFPFGMVSLASY